MDSWKGATTSQAKRPLSSCWTRHGVPAKATKGAEDVEQHGYKRPGISPMVLQPLSAWERQHLTVPSPAAQRITHRGGWGGFVVSLKL